MKFGRLSAAIWLILFVAVALSVFLFARAHLFAGYPKFYWTYLLHHPSDEVIDETCDRLVAGKGTALPMLLSLLNDESDSYHRVIGADCLGRIGEEAKPAVPDLVRALKDPDAVVQGYCAEALRKIGGQNDEVIAGLRELMASNNDFGRVEAAKAILHLAPELAADVKAVLIQISEHGEITNRQSAQQVLSELQQKGRGRVQRFGN